MTTPQMSRDTEAARSGNPAGGGAVGAVGAAGPTNAEGVGGATDMAEAAGSTAATSVSGAASEAGIVIYDSSAMRGTEGLEREMSPAEAIYGERSVVANGTLQRSGREARSESFLTENVVFESLVIVCFAAYCLLVFHYKRYILASLTIFKGKSFTDKLLDESSKVFGKFINSAILLSLLTLALSTVKFIDIGYGARVTEYLPGWGVAGLGLGLWGAIVLIVAYQQVMLKAVGGLTLDQPFAEKLISLKKIVLALTAVVVVPAFLLFALSAHQWARPLGVIIAVELSLIFILFMFKSYILFMDQKISILLWFLYLCAVEIFPVSIIVLLILKNI